MKKPIFKHPEHVDHIEHPLTLIHMASLVERCRDAVQLVEVAFLTEQMSDYDEMMLNAYLDGLVIMKKDITARIKQHSYLYN